MGASLLVSWFHFFFFIFPFISFFGHEDGLPLSVYFLFFIFLHFLFSFFFFRFSFFVFLFSFEIKYIYFANLESSQPSTTALRSFNFSKQVEDSIITFPVALLSSLSPSPISSQPSLSSPSLSFPHSKQPEQPKTEQKDKQKEEKQEKDAAKEAARARVHEEAQELVRDGADSLLVVSKYAPQTIVPQLVRALKGGAAFAVYSQYLQPLAETHELLRNAGLAVNIGLAETWLRVHQVLLLHSRPLSSFIHFFFSSHLVFSIFGF
jgi:hypothetical protein